MRDVLVLFVHLIVTIVRLMRPGGVRSVLAECVLLRHQLQVLNRPRQRAPDLHPIDRFIAGLCGGLMRPARLLRSAIVLKPATILKFHRSLVKRKYRELFSPKRKRARPGPKGPSPELGAAIVAMKRRNPRFGYQRIADQLSVAFGITLDKDTVRRVLAKHYRPSPDSGGPSWLSFLGHSRDSLYSTDLFRCESLILNTHWVMVVMDQYTRRIIGFAVHKGTLDGPAVCRMFGRIISGTPPPTYLSSDNDPLVEFHQWKANLRVLNIEEIKTVPYVPMSHPFVERLIGTIRREYLDHVPFWNARDLERKLSCFQDYYNRERAHQGLDGNVPESTPDDKPRDPVRLDNYRWTSCCRGLYQLPIAA
jgi:transposase InsO family protein